MNFGDCVLNFIFFMCSLVIAIENHYHSASGRTFDYSWTPRSELLIYGHHGSLSTFVFTLRLISHVPFWPISAYSNVVTSFTWFIWVFRPYLLVS